MMSCPSCDAALVKGLAEWHRVCRSCHYEGSVLAPRILEQKPEGDLDEGAREDALEPLRRRNFATLARAIAARVPAHADRPKPRLLDVGCAHGWFLEVMRERFDAIGIEPDRAVAEATMRRGLPVRQGFFPDVLDKDERFDVIVFNDVLEHIPQVASVMAACRRHLSSDGLLVINAPNRAGALYRLSKLLAAMGRPASFERMWQKDFPSPHLHYFDNTSVNAIAARTGFRVDSVQRLASVTVSGLYERIRYSRGVSLPRALATTAAVGALTPMLPVLPPDILVWMLVHDQQP